MKICFVPTILHQVQLLTIHLYFCCTAKCDNFADCVRAAGTRCATGCNEVTNECEFSETPCGTCCKYTPGQKRGTCTSACGANSVCIDTSGTCLTANDEYQAICPFDDPEFCLCLIPFSLNNRAESAEAEGLCCPQNANDGIDNFSCPA